jgi:thiamine-monophosphate kinase
VGEDELVAAIAQIAGDPRGRVRLGIGDDAAAWQPSRSNRSVITTDVLIEDVHFSRSWMSFHDIGVRAMAANLSDIAAMGARPVLATVALGVPANVSNESLLECYRGLAETAGAANASIVGGDLSRSPVLMLSITVVGEVRLTNLKQRSGGFPGDVLAVTGLLGASRAGLMHLRVEIALPDDMAAEGLSAFRTPAARCAEGAFLGASVNVHAMMDCSDGLSTDVTRLARASGVGARIETLPVASSASVAAALLGQDAEAFALAGGEDFELLVAVAPRAFAHLSARFAARFGRPLLRIGVLQADERLVVVKQGVEEPLAPSGWDHFS